MKMIGITGGVGAGKSEVMDYLSTIDRAVVRKADLISHELMMPGTPVYNEIVGLFGEELLNEDGTIGRLQMAEIIFKDPVLTKKVNGIIHPAVREYILHDRKEAERSGSYDLYFLEAALLIECGYGEICDEIWYIYADAAVRFERLAESRGYSDEKIKAIMDKQLSDREFREGSSRIIDNSGDFTDTVKEIERILDELNGYKS